jgi:hypothetical protein
MSSTAMPTFNAGDLRLRADWRIVHSHLSTPRSR